jgi:hypothetical protein
MFFVAFGELFTPDTGIKYKVRFTFGFSAETGIRTISSRRRIDAPSVYFNIRAFLEAIRANSYSPAVKPVVLYLSGYQMLNHLLILTRKVLSPAVEKRRFVSLPRENSPYSSSWSVAPLDQTR